jgi:hypothetical protein
MVTIGEVQWSVDGLLGLLEGIGRLESRERLEITRRENVAEMRFVDGE